MRRAVVASLVVLAAVIGGVRAAEDESLPHREPRTGIVLPKTLGGLSGGSVTRYDRPEMGISVRYSAPGFFKADLYIYDAGIKNLGTGIGSADVGPHFKELQDMLGVFEKQGKYKDVKKLREQETALVAGGRKIPALLACYEYSETPREGVEYADKRVSYILLTAYKDNFLKLPFTFPEKEKNRGDALLEKLRADLGTLLQ